MISLAKLVMVQMTITVHLANNMQEILIMDIVIAMMAISSILFLVTVNYAIAPAKLVMEMLINVLLAKITQP